MENSFAIQYYFLNHSPSQNNEYFVERFFIVFYEKKQNNIIGHEFFTELNNFTNVSDRLESINITSITKDEKNIKYDFINKKEKNKLFKVYKFKCQEDLHVNFTNTVKDFLNNELKNNFINYYEKHKSSKALAKRHDNFIKLLNNYFENLDSQNEMKNNVFFNNFIIKNKYYKLEKEIHNNHSSVKVSKI